VPSTLSSPFTPQATQPAPNGQPPQAAAEALTVTPDMALEWTGLNTRNRPVRYPKVAQFARDMKAGQWVLNGETIKIAADGTMLDGQHRLYACIQAGTPFATYVIRGLPPETQNTIDTGMPRKMADQLALRGEKSTALLAAITRWAFKWLHGVRMTGGRDQEPSHTEMTALIDADPRLRDAAIWAEHARGRFKSVNGSVYGMAWLLFHGSDHIAAEVFLEKILSGENCAAGDPALAFRNRIWKARENGERLTQHEQLGYMILAWNAFKEDRKLTRLNEPRGGFKPVTFPEPA